MPWRLLLSCALHWLAKRLLDGAQGLLAAHEAKVSARIQADIPVSDAEWTEDAKKGEL